MKITFTKLPTTVGTIKVSLDGGQSFTEHNLADVHEFGISLSDDQDFEKIRIKGPANLLKNLNVVSSVKVEGENGEIGGESLIEKLVLNGAKDFIIGSHSNPNGDSIGTYIIRMDNTKDYSIGIRYVGAQTVYPIFYSKSFNKDIILECEEGVEFRFNNGDYFSLYKKPFGIRIMNEEGVFVDPTQQITTS
jgi:hypothetical protein